MPCGLCQRLVIAYASSIIDGESGIGPHGALAGRNLFTALGAVINLADSSIFLQTLQAGCPLTRADNGHLAVTLAVAVRARWSRGE